jgi:hypothetical protein
MFRSRIILASTLIAAGLHTAVVMAQDVLFNVPYTCRTGLVLTVLRCEMAAGGEVCVYERKMNGKVLNTPSVTRTTLINLLRSCQPEAGQTSQPGAAPARPQASTPPPAAPARPQTTNPAYLSQFPSVDRVKTELKTADAMDTAARQMGAFWQLQEIIKDMSGLRWTTNALSADEKRFIGQYASAYQEAGQPYASYPDRPKWYQMHAFYETNQDFRDQLFSRFLSPAIHDQWAQVKGATRARVDASKQAEEALFREQQARLNGTYVAPPPISQRDLARCVAGGRTESQCLEKEKEERFVQGMIAGLFDALKGDTAPAPGLSISGIYSGQAGFSVMFGREAASVRCGEVAAPAGYKIDRTATQLQIRLVEPAPDKLTEGFQKLMGAAPADPTKWQGQVITLPLQPDGKIAGAGAIRVTGQVQVGTRTGERIYTDQFGVTVRKEPISEPVYETRTRNCSLGILTATGKAPLMEAGIQGFLEAGFDMTRLRNPFDSLAATAPDPGLRMQGAFAGANQFDIEFYPKAAVVACRDVIESRDYKVSVNGSRVAVNIQNGAAPIALEVRPDGTLSGPGSAKLDGRSLTGIDMKNQPVFKAVSDTCMLGTLKPSQPVP